MTIQHQLFMMVLALYLPQEIETKVRTAICFNQGCTVSNVTFQIMIRDYDAHMSDDNYEPYAPSNFELYSLIGNINNVLEGVL